MRSFQYKLFLIYLLIYLAACSGRTGKRTHAAGYDLLIRHARVADGTGNPWYYADVAIKDGVIARVDPEIEAEAKQVIEAGNLLLCPGFIDVHAHAENVYENSSERFLRMGVTTLITGNCGSSVTEVDTFLDYINKKPLALNIATLIGHNSVRRKVMDEVDRAPSPEELKQMEALVEKAMQDGAVGLSTGLIYVPGTYAKTDEIITLARAAARHKGIYASHIRDEGNQVKEAIQEAIQIGEAAGMPVEISHFKISSKKLWGSSDQTIQIVAEARRRGLQVTVDQYAYTASSTRLSSNLIPSWVLAGGFEKGKSRIAQPDTLRKIIADMKEAMEGRVHTDFSYAVVANYKADTSYNGKSIPQLAQLVRNDTSVDSQISLILDMYLAGDAQMVYHSMDEPDVERIMQEPFTMFASDAGPGNHGVGVPHPRGYGNNARVLGRYVREKRVLALEDAIRKMTSLPAQTFGLKNRGLIKEGYAADLLLIDENTATDQATFEQPHQYARGFEYVIVNGQPVISKGQLTGTLPGKSVRK
jgi:N-acyl-D-amino-acid deacylase